MKTVVVSAKMSSDLKNQAEAIIYKLGLTPSAAIRLFYANIVNSKGIPFKLNIPNEEKEKNSNSFAL